MSSANQDAKTAQEQRARRLLAEVYEPEGVELWMRGRKASLEGLTPEEAIKRGAANVVFNLIGQMISGAAT